MLAKKTRLTRSIATLFVAMLAITAHTQTDSHRKAEIAGQYWGAIIMADEMKKTECGKSISISKKWTDVEAAKREVLNNFSPARHAELKEFLTKKEENDARTRFYSMYSAIPPEKCTEAKNLFWKLFDKSVRDWEAIK
jgi:hypothetical protein